MWYSWFLHRKAAFAFATIALFCAIWTPAQAQSTPISAASILAATNAQRIADGDAALTTNARLNRVAQDRLNDLFAQQYFAHKSPDGLDVGDVADDEGYEYVEVGENLALGTYADTAELVGAWMASPGHRANILRSGFKEIGIAVGTGMFQGEESLIAVQVFGRPASLCAEPSETLRASITEGQNYVKKVKSVVNVYMQSASAIPGMNAVISQITSIMAVFTNDLNNKVAQYNKQVRDYKNCVNQ